MDDTKTIIRNAFLDLLKEKKTDKITVVDICRKAHVSRETFYYYFQDKYDLFKWLYQQVLVERMEAHKNEKQYSEMIKKTINDAMEYSYIFNNVLDASSLEYTDIIFETLYNYYYDVLSTNQPNNQLPEHIEAQMYIYLKGGIDYYKYCFEQHSDSSYEKISHLVSISVPQVLSDLWSNIHQK